MFKHLECRQKMQALVHPCLIAKLNPNNLMYCVGGCNTVKACYWKIR